jgi:hypothetical protein
MVKVHLKRDRGNTWFDIVIIEVYSCWMFRRWLAIMYHKIFSVSNAFHNHQTKRLTFTLILSSN